MLMMNKHALKNEHLTHIMRKSQVWKMRILQQQYTAYRHINLTWEGKNQLRHGSYQNATFVAAKVAQVFTGPLQFIRIFCQHVAGGVTDEGRRVPDASSSAFSAIALPDWTQLALLPASACTKRQLFAALLLLFSRWRHSETVTLPPGIPLLQWVVQRALPAVDYVLQQAVSGVIMPIIQPLSLRHSKYWCRNIKQNLKYNGFAYKMLPYSLHINTKC